MSLRVFKMMGMALYLGITGAAAGEASGAEAWREEAMETPGPQGPLRGTLLTPVGLVSPTATVLIVPGSGPTDRDGNGPLGLQTSTYRLLAEGLAARGIATVRIDKRGMFGSASALRDANDVTPRDYAHDVKQWIRSIRQPTKANCVWAMGHSEGGIVALMADPDTTEMCGLILVAVPGRPLGALLREQLQANPANAPLLDQAFGAITSLEAGQRVEMATLHPALRPLFRPAVQGFLIDSLAIDPARLITTARAPILILQGSRDLQVGVADARRLHAAAARSKLVVLPDVNHVLKTVATEDRATILESYGHADLAIAPAVVGAIADFIASLPPR